MRLPALLILSMVVLQMVAGSPYSATPTAFAAGSAGFRLDGVEITVNSSFMSPLVFTTSAAGSASQVATAVQRHPFREFSITAVSFGTRPGTEKVPGAQGGGSRAYLAALASYRGQQHGNPQVGPSAQIFGQQVAGQVSVVNLHLDSAQVKPTLIVEWVVEAGPRLWIVRLSQEQRTPVTVASTATVPSSFRDVVISADRLDSPSTVATHRQTLPRRPSRSATVAQPSWWSGDCDYTTYMAGSGGWPSYRLGAVYAGIPACGPRPAPYAENAPDVLVAFPGGWGEYEWECVELAMRYLYLQYGIDAYGANGSNVVWNYAGTLLEQIGNGDGAVLPQRGDVLSYGATGTFGHTSIVTATNVDASGNGTISVMEQNNSVDGASTLLVNNWWVAGDVGSVSGWLHAAPALFPTVYVPLAEW